MEAPFEWRLTAADRPLQCAAVRDRSESVPPVGRLGVTLEPVRYSDTGEALRSAATRSVPPGEV